MNFASETQAQGTDNVTSDATARVALGTRAMTRDGRIWRYVLAGAVDLVAGNVVQGPATIPAHLALTPIAQGVGDTTLTVTPGATGAAANFYAGGFVSVDTAPGNGRGYGISGHGAISASTAFSLYLEKDEGLLVAMTTASRFGLIPSPYRGVIQTPVTTATGIVVGVAQYVISANQYGWVLTRGLGSVLITGTPALGASVMSPGTVAGAAEVITTTNLVTAQKVGRMAQIGVNGKNNAVFVELD